MTNLDRITGAAAQSAAITWTYDGDGNRLTMSGAPGPAYAAPSLAITYNNRGRLSSVTAGGVSTAYVYNALGERIAKLDPSGSTLFMYDEVGHLLGEFDGNGNLLEETLWMGDIPVATLRPNGSGGVSVYYIHADHLNSPRAITRPSDNEIVWRWDRDPFGATQPQQNPGGLGTFVYNLRLPGQYFDPETGLSYNYMRDFDAGTGRYVESDPVGLRAGVNTYVYAKGNPNSLVDPLGLWSFTFGATWVPEWSSRLEETTGISLVRAEWDWVWVAACPGIHMVRCRVGPTRQDVEMVQSCLYLRRGGQLRTSRRGVGDRCRAKLRNR